MGPSGPRRRKWAGWGWGGERRSGIGEEVGSAEELLSATLSLHCPWFLGIMVGAGEAGAP